MVVTKLPKAIVPASPLNPRGGKARSSARDDVERSTYFSIRQWLDAPDVYVDHHNIIARHEPGTTQWFLHSTAYRQWLDNDIRHLWVHGTAGCGKSMLCATVIEDVQSHCADDVTAAVAVPPAVAYFYFSFSDVRKQTYEGVLLSLISQFISHSPVLDYLTDAYENRRKEPRVLERVLISMLARRQKYFVIVDALDECHYRIDTLTGLFRIASRCGNVKFFITSRREPDIDDFLSGLGTVGLQAMAIEDTNVDDDIGRYVAAKMERDNHLRALPSATKERLQNLIHDKAGGIFRLAEALIENVRLRPREIAHIEHSLPKSLDEIYERCLMAIDDGYAAQVQVALQWVAFAREPLTLSSIIEACTTNSTGDPISNEDDWRVLPELLNGMEPMIRVEQNHFEGSYDGVARFPHASVREYLFSDRIKGGPASKYALHDVGAHFWLSQTCIAYILHVLESSKAAVENFAPRTGRRGTFLEYSMRHWAEHQCLAEAEQTPMGQALQLRLFTDKHAMRAWIGWECLKLLDASEGSKASIRDFLLEAAQDTNTNREAESLIWSCYLNLPDTVSRLCKTLSNVNAELGQCGTALHVAAYYGNTKIVCTLLDHGAEVNCSCGSYGTALHAASYRGHDTMVELLLAKGAKLNAIGGDFGTPLTASILGEAHSVALKLLFGYGADVNLRSDSHDSPLQAACIVGAVDIVKKLLDSGADVGEGPGNYGLALQSACLQGSRDIVEALLLHGADVDDTALRIACHEGHLDIVQMLLHYGAYVNLGGGIDSALQAAKEGGHDAIVKLLIASGGHEEHSSPDTPRTDQADRGTDGTAGLISATRALDLSRDQVETSEGSDTDSRSGTGPDSIFSHPQHSVSTAPSSIPIRQTEMIQQRVDRAIPAPWALGELEVPPMLPSDHGWNPDPAAMLDSAVGHGELESLHDLLETRFDALATGKWLWLNELADSGYTRLEIAEFLLEQHEQSPWIYYQPWAIEERMPNPRFHVPGCVHADSAGIHRFSAHGHGSLTRVTHPLVDTYNLRRTIASLCGLGGVTPDSPDRRDWTGTVNFSGTSAVVDYNSDRADLPTLLNRIRKVVSKLCTAIVIMQEANACCNKFTVLCRRTQGSIAELQELHVAEIVGFHKALGVARADDVKSSQDCTRAAGAVLGCLNPPSTILRLAETAIADGLCHVHLYALAAQFICLGLVLSSQAHCGPLDPFFLEHQLTEMILLGAATSTSDISIHANSERLTCLDAMLNAPVMVFSLSNCPRLRSDRLDVLATADDLIDTWGPGAIVKNVTNNHLIASINLRGGVIYALEDEGYHWAKYEDLGDNWWVADWNRSARIVVGAPIRINTACGSDEPRCLNALQNISMPLGTHPAFWRLQGRSAGLSGGQYVTAVFNVVWSRVPGAPLKVKLLDDLRQEIEYMAFLNAPCGLQVSFCSGLAKRVRMRDLLAELMPVFFKRKLPKPVGWQLLIDQYHLLDRLAAQDSAECEDMFQRMSEEKSDCFKTFWTLAWDIVMTLKDTGLTPTGDTFVVGLVPSSSSEPMRRVSFKTHSCNFWTKALQDTESCATFAYFTLACLQVGDQGCRSTEQQWHRQVLLLQTEVHRHFHGLSAATSSAAWMPNHGEIYQLGGRDAETNAALCVKVVRLTPSADPQLIVRRSIMPSNQFKRLMQRQTHHQHLQEKLGPADHAHRAFMTSSERSTFSFA